MTGPRPGRDSDAFPAPSELPEVAVLEAQGWVGLDDAPGLWALPAVWPAQLRCWVPDRRPRIVRMSVRSARGTVVDSTRPATSEEIDDLESERDAFVAELELPAPPRGRIWLVRSPWPRELPTVALLAVIKSLAWGPRAIRPGRGSDPVAQAAVALLQDTSTQGLSRVRAVVVSEPVGHAALAWADGGADVGEHLGPVLAGATPQDVEEVETALTTAGLPSPWGREIVSAFGADDAREWIQLLVEHLFSIADLRAVSAANEVADPHEVEPLLRAGWSLLDALLLWHGPDMPWPAAAAWHHTGLPAAQVHALLKQNLALLPSDLEGWTDSGVDVDELPWILRADPQVTPSEWVAFARADLSSDIALDWLAHGFTARQALAWESVDVVPAEARFWRSQGLGPADLPPSVSGQPVLPQGDWSSMRGTDRRSRTWACQDPPGTRGSVARDLRAH
ncbi:DUF5956 family protein [Pengzhenrongella phosphoraccumulans]|uniref:DUF5956 family protein n=1 Tax=Pengzhenrongella phosphoraccumulans TaxID=3114394 RepID=UPI003890B05D